MFTTWLQTFYSTSLALLIYHEINRNCQDASLEDTFYSAKGTTETPVRMSKNGSEMLQPKRLEMRGKTA